MRKKLMVQNIYLKTIDIINVLIFDAVSAGKLFRCCCTVELVKPLFHYLNVKKTSQGWISPPLGQHLK